MTAKYINKPWYRRIGRKYSPKILLERLFMYIEDKYPSISNYLRYISHVDLIEDTDFVKIEYANHNLLSEKYIDQFKILTDHLENYDIHSIGKVDIPKYLGFVEDVIIHGHIKVPFRASNGRGFDFEVRSGLKKGRLAWGDVFVQPFFVEDYLDGDGIFIPRLNNVFHLLMENIIPAFCELINDQSRFSKKIYFLSQVDYPLLNLLAEYLCSIGYDAEVIVIGLFSKIRISRLIVARSVCTDPDLNYAYAEEMTLLGAFLDKKIANIDIPDICYVARTNTPRRNILNQKPLINRLRAIGVRSFEFRFDNYLEQIAVFRKAKLVITPHGAALSNIIWAKPSLSILELFSKNRRHKLFLHMSSQHQLGYKALIGSHTTGNDHFNAPIEDVLIEVERFRKSNSLVD